VKVVRANSTGAPVATPTETQSIVTVAFGPPLPPPVPPKEQTILAQQQPPPAPTPLTESERGRLVLFDLGAGCNVTCEEMMAAAFIYDADRDSQKDKPIPINQRAHGLNLTMPPAPRLVEIATGWRLLTSGREADSGKPPAKNLLALSSWRPYPFPAGAVIPVAMRCEKLCLLLQNYVHPLKNYISNGEVVVNYAEGPPAIESLIPPYNLDCYYQAFSRAGVCVPFGRIGRIPHAWAFPPGMVQANANALEIACDPARKLESIEIRATCSEGIIGVAGLTAIAAKD
jgi:hypothetical protein